MSDDPLHIDRIRPPSLEPLGPLIDAAKRLIPELMADVEPKSDGMIEYVASHLVKKLRDKGHVRAAAQWAIFRAVEGGRLVALPPRPWGRVISAGGFRRHVKPVEYHPVPATGPLRWNSWRATSTAEKLSEWWREIDATPPAVTGQGEGTGAKTQGKPPAPRDANTTDEPLCDRAQLVLQTLLKADAVDSDSRITTAEIVKNSGGLDPVPYKPVVADLNRRGYVNTKQGSGGGVWLTKQGKDRAAKL